MERMGESEISLMKYLSANPRSKNVDISTALKEDKGNTTNRLKRLKQKGLVEVSGKNWSLSEKGILHLITAGGDVYTIIRNYHYTQPWVKQLEILNQVLTEELPFWPEERNQVIGQLYLSLDAITKAGVVDETVILYAVTGVFKSYVDKKIKAKQMTPKKMVVVAERLTAELGGIKKTLKDIGFDYDFNR